MRAVIDYNKSSNLRANSRLNSPTTAQFSLTFPPFPIEEYTRKGNVGKSDLTPGEIGSQIGVALPFQKDKEGQLSDKDVVNCHILLIEVANFTNTFSHFTVCPYARTGFFLAENGRLVLNITHGGDWGGLFKSITSNGFDGSTALLGRVGRGIHPELLILIDANFVGREKGKSLKDHPRHLAVIANKVGDAVRGVVGMESDLFGPITAFNKRVVSLMSPELDLNVSVCVGKILLFFPMDTIPVDGKRLTGKKIVAKFMLSGSNSTITEIVQWVAISAATLDLWRPSTSPEGSSVSDRNFWSRSVEDKAGIWTPNMMSVSTICVVHSLHPALVTLEYGVSGTTNTPGGVLFVDKGMQLELSAPTYVYVNVLAEGVTCYVLVLLFTLQQYGTHLVGYIFAPVVLVWSLCISALSLYIIFHWNPHVYEALSPYYMYTFLKQTRWSGWIVLGGVLRCITRSEARLPALRHFSYAAIQIAFILFDPTLILAYIGQAAYLSKHHQSSAKISQYFLVPERVKLPVLLVAILSLVVGSQAIISGMCSIINQSQSLRCFPRVKMVHTSKQIQGQVHISEINWILMAHNIVVLVAEFSRRVYLRNDTLATRGEIAHNFIGCMCELINLHGARCEAENSLGELAFLPARRFVWRRSYVECGVLEEPALQLVFSELIVATLRQKLSISNLEDKVLLMGTAMLQTLQYTIGSSLTEFALHTKYPDNDT